MPVIPIPEISTKRLLLKGPHESFAKTLFDFHLRNKEYLKEWIYRSSEKFYTLEWQQMILGAKRQSFRLGTEFRFYLFEKDEQGTIIGEFSFSHIIRGGFQSCFLGYQIDQHHQRKGYMTEAIAAGLAYLFLDHHIHRVEANIMPRNTASIRVAEKLGFIYEGLSKEYLLVNGQWEDHQRYVKFNDRWKSD